MSRLVHLLSLPILILGLWTGGGLPARAQESSDTNRDADGGLPGGTFTVQIENDKLARTDRHYSNGFRLSWVSDRRDTGPEIIKDTLEFLYPLADIRAGRIGFSLGQTIYTPETTSATELLPNERPYAGWLFVGASLHAETSHLADNTRTDRLDTVELSLGVVGPAALGEQVQNHWHDLINVPRANGWGNQLDNEPAVNLLFERRWRPAPASFAGLQGDVIPYVGGSLGNVFTFAGVGGVARIGQNLHHDYGPSRIQPSLAGLEAIEPLRGVSWYFFAGTEGRWMLRNIFLDGNTFAESHSVESEPLVADFQAGFAVVFKGWRIAFSHVVRTEEFEGQDSADNFGALSISTHF